MEKLVLKVTATIGLIVIGTFMSCSEDDDLQIVDNLPNISGFPIVSTNQATFFNNLSVISSQSVGDDFYGQNANYPGNTPQYQDNDDGTVTDLVTGLMWQSSFDHNGDGTIDINDKLPYDEILELPETANTGGYTDWRVPTIKEQYSLIMFNGQDISGYQGTNTDGFTPFINTDYWEFAYGDVDNNERLIDVQCITSTVYVGDVMGKTTFGLNFADGRIKGYGTTDIQTGGTKSFTYLLVRGNGSYGINNFIDNGDGTITDEATGLMWAQDDNGEAIFWQDALVYAEGFEFAGYTDWRLPDVKELQSIVDYSSSPTTTNSAAIDPLFNCTSMENEAGEIDYPWYWSNTTHMTAEEVNQGGSATYVAFGKALGNMGTTDWIDVHGAGAQRSDPKYGDPSDFEDGHGPQGDAIRIYNYVRLVRNAD
ncbi:MAG: DUF1566 domain-containing protein [Bacteroidota bacterium]